MRQDLRLLPAAAGGWVLVWLGIRVTAGPGLLLLLLVLMTLLGAVSVMRRPPSGRHRDNAAGRAAATVAVACAVATVLLGLSLLRAHQRAMSVEPHIGSELNATLAITSEFKPTGAIQAGGAGTGLVEARWLLGSGVPVVVLTGEGWRQPTVGSIVRVLVRVADTDPGDRAAVLLITSGAPELVSRAPPLASAIASLRAGLIRASAGLDPHSRALVPGIAIGDDRELLPSLAQDMRAASLTHLTAVSGAHVAMVVGLVLLGLAWAPRLVRAVVATLVLAGLVMLVHPEASVLRAAAMGVVLILGLLLARPRSALPALWFSVISLLLIDPWLASSFGFVLSVSATAGLLLLARPLARWAARWLPKGLAMALAVPFAAQLACTPALALLQPAMPVHGVLANVLAAPAVPPATLLGLAATVVSPFSPTAAVAMATAASWATAWIATVATWCAGLPLAQLPWSALVGCGVVVAALWLLRRRYAASGR
ncbi:MAG: ComEC/Rec2 family competence protein [Beutenbergiaceae bacterium]